MKKKSMKRLMLKKATLNNLNNNSQAKLAGGIGPGTKNWVCPTPGTRCYICPDEPVTIFAAAPQVQ
jgi:hypothetical protein